MKRNGSTKLFQMLMKENSTSRQLLTAALKFFQSSGGANIPMQLAGASLSVVPIIVLFVFTQKFFVAGISSSGIKG